MREHNESKNKIMYNRFSAKKKTVAEGTELELVDKYTYLGQIITADHNIETEVRRRIMLGWKAFGKHHTVWNSKLPLCLKRRVYGQCVLAVMTYGSETWALTRALTQKLASAQRCMKRKILGITWQDFKTSNWIRSQTKCQDIIQTIKWLKWEWAGHLAR